MNSFNLRIASNNGMKFNGKASKVIIRTINGDVCVLSKHADFVSPLGKGRAKITLDKGDTKTAFSQGGFISVRNGAVSIASEEFEWE